MLYYHRVLVAALIGVFASVSTAAPLEAQMAKLEATVNGLEWGAIEIASVVYGSGDVARRWSELCWKERMVWCVLRVFLSHECALDVMKDPVCLSDLVNGRDDILHEICIHREAEGR